HSLDRRLPRSSAFETFRRSGRICGEACLVSLRLTEGGRWARADLLVLDARACGRRAEGCAAAAAEATGWGAEQRENPVVEAVVAGYAPGEYQPGGEDEHDRVGGERAG